MKPAQMFVLSIGFLLEIMKPLRSWYSCKSFISEILQYVSNRRYVQPVLMIHIGWLVRIVSFEDPAARF